MGNALTPLGKELRKLRIDAGERIADLAKALGCTSSFVSAVELGKRSPPDSFISGVVEHYDLNGIQEKTIRSLAMSATTAVRIDLAQGRNDLSRQVAVAFARAFPTIDRDKAAQLLQTLNHPSSRSR